MVIVLSRILRAPLRCWEQLRASLHPTEPEPGSLGAPGLRRKELFLLGAFTARVNSCPDTCMDRGCKVEE
jgi:hypothetical protein